MINSSNLSHDESPDWVIDCRTERITLCQGFGDDFVGGGAQTFIPDPIFGSHEPIEPSLP